MSLCALPSWHLWGSSGLLGGTSIAPTHTKRLQVGLVLSSVLGAITHPGPIAVAQQSAHCPLLASGSSGPCHPLLVGGGIAACLPPPVFLPPSPIFCPSFCVFAPSIPLFCPHWVWFYFCVPLFPASLPFFGFLTAISSLLCVSMCFPHQCLSSTSPHPTLRPAPPSLLWPHWLPTDLAPPNSPATRCLTV